MLYTHTCVLLPAPVYQELKPPLLILAQAEPVDEADEQEGHRVREQLLPEQLPQRRPPPENGETMFSSSFDGTLSVCSWRIF